MKEEDVRVRTLNGIDGKEQIPFIKFKREAS